MKVKTIETPAPLTRVYEKVRGSGVPKHEQAAMGLGS